jgi:hypothetical protein
MSLFDFLTSRKECNVYQHDIHIQGRIQGGGGRAPKIGKNMIFWRKIVIFHTKYLKKFRASLGN